MDNKFIYVYLSRVYSYEMHTAVSERQIVKFDKVRNCFISAQKLNNDDSDLLFSVFRTIKFCMMVQLSNIFNHGKNKSH